MQTFFKRGEYRNKKITLSARGEDCELQFDGCINDTETTMWVHSDYLEDGKGRGIKADDIFGCVGCHHCHSIYSGVIPSIYCHDELRDRFHMAMKRSIRKLLDRGIIK